MDFAILSIEGENTDNKYLNNANYTMFLPQYAYCVYCFYLTIKLFFTHHSSPCSRILHDYPRHPTIPTPNKVPNRHIYAEDYVIAARIEIFTYDSDSTPVAFTFSFYPSPTPLPPFLPNSSTQTISLLATNTHFQLLLPYRIGLPSITANL